MFSALLDRSWNSTCLSISSHISYSRLADPPWSVNLSLFLFSEHQDCMLTNEIDPCHSLSSRSSRRSQTRGSLSNSRTTFPSPAYLSRSTSASSYIVLIETVLNTLLFLNRFLNIRLDSIKVLDEGRHPHMVSLEDVYTLYHENQLNPIPCRWQ